MHRLSYALLLAAGCIHNSPRPPDDGLARAISQQERWAQDAVAGRANRAQLDAIRSSDYPAVGRGRNELKRLMQAIDRGTWIRNTTTELMSDDPDPRLPALFDRAGRLRYDAIQGADELASALGEARGGLSIGDLRPGFEALRKAQASEDRLARLPPRVGGLRLLSAPLPVPRPFIAAAARLVAANPELTRELDRLPPDDAAQIRARLADLDRGREEQKHAAPAGAAPVLPPATSEEPPPPGEGIEAEAPSPTLKIANDAAALLAKRAPRSITLREDGLFDLSYDDADYLVDPSGKLIRKESPQK